MISSILANIENNPFLKAVC